MSANGAVMDATPMTTGMTTPAAEVVARKPRKRELKNLTRRGGIWYFHKRVNGKKEFNGMRTPFSLETRDLVVAKAKRDKILNAANGAEVDRVLGRQHQAAAKMGVVFAAYRKAPTVRANEDTRDRNIGDLQRMIRAVRGAEFNVDEMSTLDLNKQLVKEWQSLRIAEAIKAAAGDLAKVDASKRSINSLLTHVQSLFSREARDDYGGVYLPPNVLEFATALPVAARKQEEPEQLSDEFVTMLLAGVDQLQVEDPGAWATFNLMTWGGLRNTECYHARESWLEQVAMGYRLRMKPTEDFIPKGNSRAVILPLDIIDAVLEQLPFGPVNPESKYDRHLVPAKHASDRHEAVYRRLNAWLKGKGVGADAGKIAYRLRKYFLNKVNEQQGLMFAQAAAGHSSSRTTEEHYVGKRKMAEPIKLAAR